MTLELQIGRVKRLGEQIHMVGVEEMRETKAPKHTFIDAEILGKNFIKTFKTSKRFLTINLSFLNSRKCFIISIKTN